MKFLLASGSPRRKMLLEQMNIHPTIVKPDILEQAQPGETPAAYIQRNCQEKAQSVAKTYKASEPTLLIAADTIVVLDQQILEKPDDHAAARAMLLQLAGRQHEVKTAFCVGLVTLSDSLERSSSPERTKSLERSYVQVVTSQVHFRPLESAEIDQYIATEEPMDKAGSYGAQGLGSAFIKSIEGSYTNVVGLPMYELLETLRLEFQWQPF